MRWMLAIAGCLMLAPAVFAQDAAQKLFETMEQKLATAKAYQFNADVKLLWDGHRKFNGKACLTLSAGNRMKFTYEGEGRADKLIEKGTVISDGKMLSDRKEVNGKPEKPSSMPVNDKLSEIVTSQLSRAGLYLSVVNTLTDHPSREMRVSGFKMTGKDKVGDRDANVIEYQVSVARLIPPGGNPGTCKLWLDAQTNLPLQRILEFNGGTTRFVETYSRWVLDPKLPEGTFTLP